MDYSSILLASFNLTGFLKGSISVQGKMRLCSQISNGEARKVKHAGLLQRKELFACPGTPGMDVIYNLMILCSLLSQTPPISSRIICLSQTSLPIQNLEPYLNMEMPFVLYSSLRVFCYFRARPVLTLTGFMFSS